MDISNNVLHYPNMKGQLRSNPYSTDALYGESPTEGIRFRFHCETLFSRSSLHRFEIGLHRHEAFVQFLYISTGEGDATLDGAVHAIHPPAVIFVPPFIEHGFRFSRNIDGVVVTTLVSALPASVQALLHSHLKQAAMVPLSGHASSTMIDAAFLCISREHAATEPGWDVLCEGQIASLIALVSRMVKPADPAPMLDLNTHRFETLLALIGANIRAALPAAFYAGRLGISQTHLNRLVRAKCGLSLQQLIARRQIELAQQELLFTMSPVRTVASSLGFNDPAYFSRFFLRETGETPKRWREKARRNLASADSPHPPE